MALPPAQEREKAEIFVMKMQIETWLRVLNNLAAGMQSPFLLLVRLYWGWQFIETGWGKVNNIGKVVEFFTTLGFPHLP